MKNYLKTENGCLKIQTKDPLTGLFIGFHGLLLILLLQVSYINPRPDLETGLPFRAQSIIANPPAYGEFNQSADCRESLM